VLEFSSLIKFSHIPSVLIGIPMTDKSESQSVPAGLRQIARTFSTTGWVSFWSQIVLGVISGVVLLVSSAFSGNNANQNNPGTGFGAFLAVCGLLVLCGSIYMAFRYTTIAKQLQSPNPSQRPRKADTIQVLRLGLLVNLAGMLVTLFGAYAIVGTLVGKSISQAQTALLDPNRVISGLDMFVVQANINTIGAHFVGIVAALWLLNRISRS
jgi:Protein of unknown function (DUF3611)